MQVVKTCLRIRFVDEKTRLMARQNCCVAATRALSSLFSKARAKSRSAGKKFPVDDSVWRGPLSGVNMAMISARAVPDPVCLRQHGKAVASAARLAEGRHVAYAEHPGCAA
jgi:hypothetical protein